MPNQYLSIFFLSLSTILMLGHAMIPHHHHHQEDSDLSNHLHQENYLGIQETHRHLLFENILSLGSLEEKDVECLTCPDIDETFNNEYFGFNAVIPIYFEFRFPFFETDKSFLDFTEDLFISSYFPPGGLRAPPILS